MSDEKKPKRGEIVVVRWLDQSHYTGPVESGFIAPCNGESVGYFLEESDDWLSIGMEFFYTEVDRMSYRHICTFPKVCIRSIEIFRPKKA